MAPTTIVSDSWSTPSWASSNICSTKAGHTNPCVLRSSGETFTPGTFQGLPMVGSPQPPTVLPIPLRQGIPWSMGIVYGPTYSMGCCGGGSLWGSMGVEHWRFLPNSLGKLRVFSKTPGERISPFCSNKSKTSFQDFHSSQETWPVSKRLVVTYSGRGKRPNKKKLHIHLALHKIFLSHTSAFHISSLGLGISVVFFHQRRQTVPLWLVFLAAKRAKKQKAVLSAAQCP